MKDGNVSIVETFVAGLPVLLSRAMFIMASW